MDLLLKIQKLYEEKEGLTFTIKQESSFESQETKIYLSKDLRESITSFSFRIRFIRASESSIFFKCDRFLHDHTVIFVEHSTELYLTVLHYNEKDSEFEEEIEEGFNVYEGLVHGIHEMGIQKLRQYVN